jgi:general secretion pathway protein A
VSSAAKEPPFAATCSPQFVFETESRRDALARLDEGLGTREPFVVVTGAAGTGKTTLLQSASARWGDRAAVAFLTNAALSRDELAEEIARRFGATPAGLTSKPERLACLERTLTEWREAGQVPIVVVEDAHRLDAGLLDELRLIANAEAQAGRVLEVVLVGLPELEVRLEEPGLGAIRERISVRCRVEPLSQQETRDYLRHRIAASGGDGTRTFPKKACHEVHALSGGVPRAINLIATEAMRAMRDGGADAVTPEHVRGATAARTPAPRETAAAASGESAPAPAHDAAPAPNDPRVREWVHRFVGAQGPPRIGVRVGFIDPEAQAFVEREDWANALEPPAPAPAAPDDAVAPANDLPPFEEPSTLRELPASAPRPTRGPRHRSSGAARGPSLAVIGLVAMAVGVVVLLPRGIDRASGARDARAVAATPEMMEPAAPTPIVRGVAKPPEPREAVAAEPSPTPVAAEAPRVRLALDVATYLDELRAEEERDRLAAETGLKAWVVTGTEYGAPSYRVVLGVFSNQGRADSSATVLLERGLVSEARVIPLPPRSTRH